MLVEPLGSGHVMFTICKGMTVSVTLTAAEAIELASKVGKAAAAAMFKASTDTCPVCLSFGRNCCVAHKVELTK